MSIKDPNKVAMTAQAQPLSLETAVAISEAESIHVNLQYELIPEEPRSKTPITLILGNYNNGEKIREALDSILDQRGCNFRLIILDNHSTDQSWEIICNYKSKYDIIEAERLPFNTGPFTWGVTLFQSPVAGYMMPCSGNDVLLDNRLVASFATYLDNNQGICLAYGQNDQEGKQDAYTFTIPEIARRANYGSLDSAACHDIATWLYNYSESLWGMYRTDLIKLINAPCSYGSDHVIVSGLSCLGGISGIRQKTRRVSSNHDRGLEGLRIFQINRQHSLSNTVLTPLEHTNFMMLCYSYFQGIRDSHLREIDRDNLVTRTMKILSIRFPGRIKEEALIYGNLFPKIRAIAQNSNDMMLMHRIDCEDSFVRHYCSELFA